MSDASSEGAADGAMDASSEERTAAESAAAVERYESSLLPSHPAIYVLLLVGGGLILLGAGPASGESTGLLGLWGTSLIVGVVASYVAYLVWHVVG